MEDSTGNARASHRSSRFGRLGGGGPWAAFAGAGVVAATAHFLVPLGETSGIIYLAVAVSGPVAVLVGIRRNRPEFPRPWYLFAAGLAVFLVGDLFFYFYKLVRHVERPFPSVADAFYLASYPLLIAGLLSLIRRRNPGGDRASLIDACIIATGIGLVAEVYLIAPSLATSSTSVVERLISFAYPLADVALLAVAARLAVSGGARRPAYYLVGTAIVCLLGADVAYAVSQLTGTFQLGTPFDAGWMGFYLFWGVAALHPSMASLTEPGPVQGSAPSRIRLLVLAGGVLLAPAVLAAQTVRDDHDDLSVIAAASVILFLLVMSRMGGLIASLATTAGRERTLRGAAAALGASPDRQGIYAASLSAARDLVADPDAEVHLAMWSGTDVVAAAYSGDEERCSATTGSPAPPTAGILTLGGLNSVLHGPDDDERPVRDALITPVLVQDELQGAIVVIPPGGPPSDDVCHGLDTLASQLGMALERTALADDLHQRRGEARFRSLVQSSSDVITVVDPDTTVRYQTPSVQHILGYDPSELLGTRILDLVHPTDLSRALAFFALAAAPASGNARVEMRARRRDGSWVDVEAVGDNLLDDPNVGGIVVTLRDISERKAFEDRLTHQAFHDSLTGLANRALFTDRVQHALRGRSRDSHAVAVVFLDLDDFKTVNDSLGHAAGDKLLVAVAERIVDCLRPQDTTARLGGDEFAILLQGMESSEATIVAAERVLQVLHEPFSLEAKEVDIRASVGIAFADEEAATSEDLLRNADIAMYMAKSRGRGGYELFEPRMHEAAMHRLHLKADLQRGLDQENFVLHYQPIVDLDSGRVVGFEALVRWDHPTRGLLGPDQFISLAEETNLIQSLGCWVLDHACRRARSWYATHGTTMSINISQRQLDQPGLVEDVQGILRRTGTTPAAITLEITESAVMRDADAAIAVLHRLRDLGVRLAIDDFGTGYSSLAALRQLPIDVLKIDKAFVNGVATNPDDAVLVGTVIDLARGLRLTTVAEGIEDVAQLQSLRRLHCGLGQGYHFSRPVPPEAASALLDHAPSTSKGLQPTARGDQGRR